MTKVVVFGNSDHASLAHYYLREDSSYEVVGFTVNQSHVKETHFEGKPVVPFEEIDRFFPPSEYKFFAPISHRRMNSIRRLIYEQAKTLGYSLISYVSSAAWRAKNVTIGENCFILENNTLQPYVRIGNNVVLWSGNHIGHHSIIHDHVFIASHVVVSGSVIIHPHCFVGVNAAIRDNIEIAEGSLIGMSACITKSTEPWGVYAGLPAKKTPATSKEFEA